MTLLIVTSLCYLIAAWFPIRHYIHMFQLNSYKPKVQLKWLKSNNHLWIALPAVALIAVLWDKFRSRNAGLGGSIEIFTVIAAIFIYTVIAHFPKKSYKIPLKYTARVKRLIFTSALLYLLPVALNIWLPLHWTCAVYVAMLILAPFLVLLTNLINRPVELSINSHYINDAKRILRECPNLTVIGITGSFGKTSVKYFLYELLSVKYNVLKTPGNFNTPLGIVKTIRSNLRATHDIFLCEMGAKNVGDIKEICDIVCPEHGIITAVGPMHLESFGTIDNVRKTKFELADALPSSGYLWLNTDDENVREGAKGRTYIGYGVDSRDGYCCEKLSISSSGSEFDIVSPNGETEHFKTKLIGKHNVINICGAVAAANTLEISLKDLKPAVRRLESVPHRLELRKSGNVTIIDDAYNSNPAGARAALETLSMMDGFKILCTPGMIELGEREYELNREFGATAAEVCDFVITVGKTNADAISDGLRSKNYPAEKVYAAPELRDAFSKIYSLPNEKKVVLLENDLPDNY